MAQPEKIATVESLSEVFKRARSIVLNDFTGLNVEKLSNLRKICRDNQIEYRVVKNTLAKRGIKGTAAEPLEKFFEGPTALAFSVDSENLPAKILAEFAKENEAPEFKAALVGEELLAKAQVIELAKLPAREELLANLMGGLKSPVNNLLFVLQGVLRKFMYALNAIQQKKQSEDVSGASPQDE